MTVRLPLSSGDADPLTLSSVLADPRQRRILSVLLERPHPLTDRDLAIQLAARGADDPASDVAEEDVQRLLTELRHRHLPKLETVGWIDRRPEGIVATERLPFGDGNSSFPPLEGSERRWDVLTALLARPRRQRIVAVLARRDRPFALDELAAELAADERIATTTDEDEDDLSLPAVLHHIDLPRLAEVGLLEYDRDEGTIARGRALATVVDWIEVDDRRSDDPG